MRHSAVRAGTALGSAAKTSYRLGQETSGSASFRAGAAGVASAAGHVAGNGFASAIGIGESAERGQRAALHAGSHATRPSVNGAPAMDDVPKWARQLRSEQASRHHRHMALQTMREGDRGGAGMAPDISEKEEH